MILKSWQENLEGSHRFILQKKLKCFIQQTKKWCINYRAETKISWQDIHSNLNQIRQKFCHSISEDLEQHERRRAQEDISLNETF